MTITRHAAARMSQRGIPQMAVDLAVAIGAVFHRTGIEFFVIRGKDLRRAKIREPRLLRFEGTTVLVSAGEVITAYKKRDISQIRRKAKQAAKFSRRGNRNQRRPSGHAREKEVL